MHPILPSNPKSPNMVDTIVHRAQSKLRGRLRRAQVEIVALFNAIPRERVGEGLGGIQVNASEYLYLLDSNLLQQTSFSIRSILERLLLDGSRSDWFMYQSQQLSYESGTANAIANLTSIAGEEAIQQLELDLEPYRRNLQQVLFSRPYQERLKIVSARMFEEMENMTGQAAVDLRRVLGDGMAAGDNPRVIAERIREEIGLSLKGVRPGNQNIAARALKIARTEVNAAHREARRAENKEAESLGIHTREMWLSALSPTTRTSHARRHGHLYTQKENKDFYLSKESQGGQINCRCSAQAVLVDDKGNPYDSEFAKKVQSRGKLFFGKS